MNKNKPSFSFQTFLSVSSLLGASAAFAADVTWDNSQTVDSTWSTSIENWTTDGGVSYSAWDNDANAADTALFTTAFGTVTLAEAINLGGIRSTVSNASYTIAGGSLNFGALTGIIDTSALGTSGSNLATISSNLTGTGGLSIAASGNLSASGGASGTRLVLSGDNTGLTGNVTVTSGLVAFSSNTAAGSESTTAGSGFNLVLNGGGILHTGASQPGTLGNNIEIGAAGGVIRVYGSQTLILNGAISGTGTLTKTDGGTLRLMGSTSGSGAINVQAGTLQLGSGTFTYEGTGLTIGSGATLGLPGSSSGTATHTHAFSNLSGPISVNGGTVAFSSTNTTTKNFNAALDFSGTSTISYTSSSFTHTLNLTQAITGTGTLNFTWSGGASNRTINLTGTGSDYTGNVVLGSASGAASMNVNQVLGEADWTINNANWTVNFNTHLHTLASLNGTVNSAVQGSGNLSIGEGSYAGRVGGNLNLTKTGDGTLTLSGSNTFTGLTTVTDGTLVANHANALGTGDVIVGVDGTLQLGASTGVELSGVTSLSLLGTLVFTDTDSKIVLSGDYILIGATFDLNNLYNTEGTYQLFDVGGTGSGTVSFVNVDSGFNYSFDQGVLTVSLIPEPSTYALLGAMVLGLATVRRRRG